MSSVATQLQNSPLSKLVSKYLPIREELKEVRNFLRINHKTLKPAQIQQVIFSKARQRINAKHSKFATATHPQHFFTDRSQSPLPNRSISLHSIFKWGERGWPEEGQPESKKCGQEQNKGLFCRPPVTFQSEKSRYALSLGEGGKEVVSTSDLCFEYNML